MRRKAKGVKEDNMEVAWTCGEDHVVDPVDLLCDVDHDNVSGFKRS